MTPLLLALSISSQPAAIQLGTQDRAVLRVEATPGSHLVLRTNSGSVGEPAEISPGVFTADYRPPDDNVPRVAIVTARAGDERAWMALPLWGSADALLRARPGSRVAVTIGPNSFGPVRADAKGVASVHVVIPPGVGEAKSGSRTIPLHVPETAALAVALDRDAAPADRAAQLDIHLFAVMPDGRPRADAAFVLQTTRGSISSARAVEPGVFVATWSIPPGPSGEAALTAALAGSPLLTQRATLTLDPGPAAAIELSAERNALVSGEPGLMLRARARDSAGNASPETLRFETTFGEIGATPDAPGAWTLHLRAPPQLGGRTSLRLTAHGSQTSASIEIALRPAEAERVEIAAGSIRADGRAVDVRLSLADRFGNPVHGGAPRLSADTGDVGPAVERDGSWHASYVPPVAREASSVALVALAGPARAERRIELAPQVPLLAISPKVGLSSNFSDLTSPLLGVEAALRSDRFGPLLELLGEASWTFSTADATAPVAVRSRTDYVTAALAVGAFLPLASGTRAFVHAGPTLARVSSTLRIGAQPSSSAATIVPGGQISLGLERRVRSVLPFAEARWSFTGDPALAGVVDGSLRSLSFHAGVRFELF